MTGDTQLAASPAAPVQPSAMVCPPASTEALPLADLFDPSRPIEVDVGCGKGGFLLARAFNHPDTNFLGVDRLLRRLRKIDKKIGRESLTNVKLLHIEAAYAITQLLPPHSITTFYVFFPDPWPKRRHHRRRLFDLPFLDSLSSRLIPGGCVHMATDHLDYFDSIVETFSGSPRFRRIDTFEPADDERTDFELLFMSQGKPIGRASYQTPARAQPTEDGD